MRPPRPGPARSLRRPAEPPRPLPARKLSASLLGLKARRLRRRRGGMPPDAGQLERW